MPGIALRSFSPVNLVLARSEELYSNRFRAVSIPDNLKRFTATHELDSDRYLDATDPVGEILIANPKVAVRRHQFKFYI
jgi:hypothetical protein